MPFTLRPAVSAAAVLTIVSLAAGVSPAAAAPAPPSPVAGKPLPATVPAPRATIVASDVVATSSTLDCARVKADPRSFLKAGRTEVACTAPSSAAVAAAAPVSCKDSAPSTFWYSRASLCLAGYNRNLQTVDASGAVTGTATVEIATDMVFQTQRLTWSENWYLTLTAATGRLTTMDLTWTVTCGTNCSTRNTPAGAQTVTVGQTVSGTTTYSVNPLGRGEWKQTYSLTATDPQGDAIPAQTYSGARTFRCDRIIGPSAGCVVPSVVPAFGMSKAASAHPRSTQSFWYLQLYFPDGWGSSTPLHRLMDSTTQQAGYDAICNDGTYVKDGSVYQDTCNIFPFASTYENGHLLGLQASDCVDGVARQSRGTGEWYVDSPAGTVDYSEHCIRSHVEATDYTEFTNRLNTFYRDQRLLDYDAFTVTVVN
ncbi:hypothetical protein COUCH_13180 [Couchioplanes caeruleus]|uniref:hypothetical protein n=1 Tax=Couchioplanes caeruleus TaxID=56438 RepID=UPI0020BD46DB|nr:hypothetical protein [Couchioplanes caeruleus]UQU67159.1 hypothetical protein COUCH_13180 [Couchioplanes caeruleus]